MWEKSLVGLEGSWMHTATAVLCGYGMLEVEHLVVEQVLDRIARNVDAVEDAAHYDGIVRGIVVAQQSARRVAAPGQNGLAHQAMEELVVEFVEDFFEVVVVAARWEQALAAALLADLLGLFADCFGGDVAAITVVVNAGDRFLVKLRKQDMRDGLEDILRRSLQQVGETDMELTFAQTDRGVE